MSFVSAAIEELGARRRRLQTHFKPLLGGLIEFALLSGLVLGVPAVFLGRWYGLLPILAFVAGYVLLERRRQAALAAGQEEALVRRQYDRLSLALAGALAAIGLWIFVGAMGARNVAGWTEPPPTTIDLDLVTE